MFGRYLRRLVPTAVTEADLALFHRVARLHSPLMDATIPRLSRLADHSALWFALAALFATLDTRFGARAALRGMLAIATTSFIANQPGKLLTRRKRPSLALIPHARRIARLPTSTSFPSGHSASAAAFATAAGMEVPNARVPLGALAALVGFSRVYTGAHYPGDVAAGMALGTGLALATKRAWPLVDPTPAEAEAVAGWRPDPHGAGLVIVVNNQAGTALRPDPARRLREALPAARMIAVDTPTDLHMALQEAARTARVIGIAGGDGSVNTAARVANDAGRPLLVVPGGTLNRLATELGMRAVRDTIAAVRDGEVIRVDLAEVDGRRFCNAASIGVYPQFVDTRNALAGALGTWPAAMISTVRTWCRAWPSDIHVDGQRVRLWHLFVGNCRYTGEGITPTRRRRLDDGLLDVRIVHAGRPWSRLRFLAASLAGRVEHSAVYERRIVRSVDLRSSEPLRLARDGETGDATGSFTISKCPDPVLLLVPPMQRHAQRRHVAPTAPPPHG